MFTERWYQTEAVASFFDYIIENKTKDGVANPLIIMPTGSGKSVVISRIIQVTLQWENTAVLVLTHVAELVKQNVHKFCNMVSDINVGICCSGLGRKNTQNRVIFGTIQTVASVIKKTPSAFGDRCLVIIDECHLVSSKDNSQYRTVIKTLQEQNPDIVICGLSATPYRINEGLLCEQKNPIFTGVAYDLNSQFIELVNQGFLAPLVTIDTPIKLDLSKLSIQGNDYKTSDIDALLDNTALLNIACDAIIQQGKNRQGWLVFASGIANVNVLADILNSRGISTRAVSSHFSKTENDKSLALFARKEVTCLVSANQLTTGFDAPHVDLIAVLRPTISASLHCQMLGRGTRVADGKTDCLVLDFAQNCERLGPINNPIIPTPPVKKVKKSLQENDKVVDKSTQKLCPFCGAVLSKNARSCDECGGIFPQDFNFVDAYKNIPMSFDVVNEADFLSSLKKPLEKSVKGSTLGYIKAMHITDFLSKNGNKCIRVSFSCFYKKFFKVHLYMTFGRKNSSFNDELWHSLKGIGPTPKSCEEVLERRHELSTPYGVETLKANYVNRKYDEIVQFFW